MELNWKEDNNLVRKIAKILLGDTLPNGEPVSSLVLIDTASRAELQRWADMSDAEFEAARQSGDTIHIDVDDEIKRITEEYGLDPNSLDDLLAEFDEDADDDMEIFSDAESEIDQDLLAEIEEWKQQEHDKPEEYYFSNPDPYLKPQPLAARSSPAQLLLQRGRPSLREKSVRVLAAGVHLAKGNRRHSLHRHRQL